MMRAMINLVEHKFEDMIIMPGVAHNDDRLERINEEMKQTC